MHQFHTAFKQGSRRLSDREVNEVKGNFSINDDRSTRISIADAFAFQFHAHWYVNSRMENGQMVNLYNFNADGLFGAYPTSGKNSVLIDPDGLFRLQDGHLPLLANTILEMTPDAHRGNENRVLTAFHLLLAKLHNKRMAIHGDFNKARDEVVCAFNNAFERAAMNIVQMDDEGEFRSVAIKDFHKSFEWTFAVGRFGHVQMPETFGGKGLFDKTEFSSDVDMVGMTTEMAGKIGMRISPAMHGGSEGGQGKSILDHTVVARHNIQNVCTFDDAALALRRVVKSEIDVPACPLWAGMMREADMQDTQDTFGPVGRRLIADGISGTLAWGQDIQKGLWYDAPDDLPLTVADIIAYAW